MKKKAYHRLVQRRLLAFAKRETKKVRYRARNIQVDVVDIQPWTWGEETKCFIEPGEGVLISQYGQEALEMAMIVAERKRTYEATKENFLLDPYGEQSLKRGRTLTRSERKRVTNKAMEYLRDTNIVATVAQVNEVVTLLVPSKPIPSRKTHVIVVDPGSHEDQWVKVAANLAATILRYGSDYRLTDKSLYYASGQKYYFNGFDVLGFVNQSVVSLARIQRWGNFRTQPHELKLLNMNLGNNN